jgi:hypothetical protein
MFSILISANGTSWETDQLMRSDVDRFKEQSGSESSSVSLEDPVSLKSLEKEPALLMYESGTKDGPNPDLVRYGFARNIRQVGREVVFHFEEHGHLSKSDIAEFADRLGMGQWEKNRTHWAIKDGGIPSALLSRMKRLHVGERRALTVFYAWQSDRPSSSNRRFIREALDMVVTRIAADRTCAFTIRIDQDTDGVPGLCDIPSTILHKIAKADALVADLTYIAKSEADLEAANETPRYCSNPNVLFELGYAFHAIGWERLICVMNEKYGPRTEQIFDLDHRRHPIAFTLPGDKQSRQNVLASLSDSLEGAIRSVFSLELTRSVQQQGAGDADLPTLVNETVARCEHDWKAERNNKPKVIDGGKSILNSMSQTFADFERQLAGKVTNDVLQDIRSVVTGANGLQKHHLYLDGGKSFSDFWEMGDGLIRAAKEVAARVRPSVS